MIRMVRAELTKLRRRRVIVATVVAAAAFALVATLAVFLSAAPAGTPRTGRGVTLGDLARAGGGTRAFAVGASFLGILVFVTFIANVAGEFSHGTFRTLLMRQPRRVRLIAGKMTALLLFAAAVLVVAEILTLVASTLVAPTQGVSTASWFSLAGLGEAAGHYVTALSAGPPGDVAGRRRAFDAPGAGHRHRLGRPLRAHHPERLGRRLPLVPRAPHGGAGGGRHSGRVPVAGGTVARDLHRRRRRHRGDPLRPG
jgi:hypothetical protein